MALVIDCYSRKIVGWAMSDNYKTPLITSAITMATRNITLPRLSRFPLNFGGGRRGRQAAITGSS